MTAYFWHSRCFGAKQQAPRAFSHSPGSAPSARPRPVMMCSQSSTAAPAARQPFDYVQLMQRRRFQPSSCPPLLLAPMEGLADAPFRKAFVSSAGGFDEACTEFIRVPNSTSHPRRMVRGLTASYNCQELGAVPLAAQVMGSNKELLALTARRLVHVLGAPRLDLNCGCPANTVTGKMAGSSLLKDPQAVHDTVSALVQAVAGAAPVTVKMRSGFEDTSLFEQNLLAVQQAGAAFVTIHPRTKRQAYDGRADWSLIARARQLLRIPVVGNGDVVSVQAARMLLQETGCDAVMVGRGAVQDPLLFHRIRFAFAQEAVGAGASSSSSSWPFDEPGTVEAFLRHFADNMLQAGRQLHGERGMSEAGQFGHLKKVIRYLFASQPVLMEEYRQLVRLLPRDMSSQDLLDRICLLVRQHWPAAGPCRQVLVNHMSRKQAPVEMASTPAGGCC